MVMPIVEAVLQQILRAKEESAGEDNPNLELDGTWIYSLLSFWYMSVYRHTLKIYTKHIKEIFYCFYYWYNSFVST